MVNELTTFAFSDTYKSITSSSISIFIPIKRQASFFYVFSSKQNVQVQDTCDLYLSHV